MKRFRHGLDMGIVLQESVESMVLLHIGVIVQIRYS